MTLRQASRKINLSGSQIRMHAKAIIIGKSPVTNALKYSTVSVFCTREKSIIKQSKERNTWTLSPTVFTVLKNYFREVGKLSWKEAVDDMI